MLGLVVAQVKKYQQIIRFLITGGIAFVINISVLYIATDILHIYYLISILFAFVSSFSFSFTTQKLWTFKDHSRDHWRVQLYRYLILQLVNLGLNACFLFAFVEFLHIWYLLSQSIILVALSVISFVVNKGYIFRHTDQSL